MGRNEIELDQDGYFRDPQAWSREAAQAIAAQAGIESLTEDHWKVITRLRKHYLANRQIPVMRHICREAGLEQHCVSDLLADPALAWRIAGLPNPGEEAKAYLESAELHE